MLKQRILTALILIPLVFLGIFYLPPIAFSVVTAAIMLLGMWEWTKLMNVQRLSIRIFYLLGVVILTAVLMLFPVGILLSLLVLFWLVMIYYLFHYDQFTKLWSYFWLKAIFGFVLFFSFWLGLTVVRLQLLGIWYILLLLLLIWGADTGAYFAGRAFGKHKLAPQISPGKTVEGMIGGLLTTLVIGAVAGVLSVMHGGHGLFWVILSIIIGIVSVAGDLFESLVKRQSGVKDSGNWLPGHGGILDRLDSLIAAAPFFALAILLFS